MGFASYPRPAVALSQSKRWRGVGNSLIRPPHGGVDLMGIQTEPASRAPTSKMAFQGAQEAISAPTAIDGRDDGDEHGNELGRGPTSPGGAPIPYRRSNAVSELWERPGAPAHASKRHHGSRSAKQSILLGQSLSITDSRFQSKKFESTLHVYGDGEACRHRQLAL